MILNNNSSDQFGNDILTSSLIELAKELEKADVPLIVGGGLSLYLRTTLFKKKYSPRYPKRVLQRSTKDIDIFLSSDLIIDSAKIELIRNALKKLNYEPVTKFFQFSKSITPDRNILVDILSAPPPEEDADKIKVRGVRIKPVGIEEFHARLVKEAKDINLGSIPINDFSNLKKNVNISNLFIPSSFNYIILKLHAFNDRVNDSSVEYGQHHAYDIFATITDMDEEDWKNAEHHFSLGKDFEYIKSAQNIVSNNFSNKDNMGIIRLQESKLYQRFKTEYDSYIMNFIGDLKTLFDIK